MIIMGNITVPTAPPCDADVISTQQIIGTLEDIAELFRRYSQDILISKVNEEYGLSGDDNAPV